MEGGLKEWTAVPNEVSNTRKGCLGRAGGPGSRLGQ